MTPPNAKATARVFVAANGVKKLCRFTRGEGRSLWESRLEEQLRRAEYLATEKFNPEERSAT